MRTAPDQLSRARVRAAFRAAAERLRWPLLRADVRACCESDDGDAAALPSWLSARRVAREREADTAFFERPALKALWALFRVDSEVFPFFGALRLTPARRALDRPIAIACSVDRAPCFPSRIWCISSRTNSPACVDGDLP